MKQQIPSFLCSYTYLKGWEKFRSQLNYSEWVLDSGAFSKTPITVDTYRDTCLRLLDTEKPPVEIFGLDVIGDPVATHNNCKLLHKAIPGIIPTYHLGEPLDFLKEYSKEYPKIAIGGCAKKSTKVKADFAARCFQAIYPHRIHAFGYGSKDLLMKFPFETADSSCWDSYWRFGNAISYKWRVLCTNKRGMEVPSLRQDVLAYLRIEAEVRARWRGKFKHLRLAIATGCQESIFKSLEHSING